MLLSAATSGSEAFRPEQMIWSHRSQQCDAVSMERTIFEDEHEMFRRAYRAFLDREMVPRADEWDRAGIVSRDVWKSAGSNGFLAFGIPEAYGGPGVDDFRYNLVVVEEMLPGRRVRGGDGVQPPQRRHAPLLPPLHERRAEGALAARAWRPASSSPRWR